MSRKLVTSSIEANSCGKHDLKNQSKIVSLHRAGFCGTSHYRLTAAAPLTAVFPYLKWLLWILPSVLNVIDYLNIVDVVTIAKDFWLQTAYIFLYECMAWLTVVKLFLQKER